MKVEPSREAERQLGTSDAWWRSAAPSALAAVVALCLAACTGVTAGNSATNASRHPDPPGCSGYRPICISGDSVCSVDSNGCSICTCQSRVGESAPDLFVPGTSAPAPPMGR